MEINSLLDQVFQRWETLLAAWNFYLIVAFVLLGFFILSKTARTERKVFRLLAVGWVFFTWTHLLGILYMVKQWTAVAAMLKEAIAAREGGTEFVVRLAGAGIVEAPNAVWIVPFHLLLDAFVFFGMWVLCRPQFAGRLKQPQKPSPIP